MKTNMKISTKIKLYMFLLVALMAIALAITIHYNNKNVNDSQLINVAGQQRMLTQKITKEIFFIYESHNLDTTNLDAAVDKFSSNFAYIKNRDEIKEIMHSSNSKITLQIKKIEQLWNGFFAEISEFKKIMDINHNDKDEKRLLEKIYNKSDLLLNEVHELVVLLTDYNENKNSNIIYIQYVLAGLLFIVILYITMQLKHIEANTNSFIEYSKNLASSPESLVVQPLNRESEKELVEMGEVIESFAMKINSAINFSNEALLQSEYASAKLEEISGEFDFVLKELRDPRLNQQLNDSEDIIIESTEELLNSIKKLSKLKQELDQLAIECSSNSA